MALASDLSLGSFIRYNGDICQIIEWQHRTPGNWRAFYQATMRNLRTGGKTETRFRPDEAVEVVRLEMRELQYLYRDGDSLVCMDNETYEQPYVNVALFGENIDLLKEGSMVIVGFDGDTPVIGQLPHTVVLEITYTEPGVKGDTATKAMKPATLETGAQIKVPLFCDVGDKIRVDTRTREYMERVKE
ncbi:MAG: elongation factor P [Cytophagales bacterium]|nr:elongation factor P [Bernardetiaceae bacterium]MDW8210603.1 elongation factor P [Cytophagales bacterium]